MFTDDQFNALADKWGGDGCHRVWDSEAQEGGFVSFDGLSYLVLTEGDEWAVSCANDGADFRVNPRGLQITSHNW